MRSHHLDLVRACRHQTIGREAHVSAMPGAAINRERERLDAVIAPATGPAWPIDLVLGDHFISGGYSVAAVAGPPPL